MVRSRESVRRRCSVCLTVVQQDLIILFVGSQKCFQHWWCPDVFLIPSSVLTHLSLLIICSYTIYNWDQLKTYCIVFFLFILFCLFPARHWRVSPSCTIWSSCFSDSSGRKTLRRKTHLPSQCIRRFNWCFSALSDSYSRGLELCRSDARQQCNRPPVWCTFSTTRQMSVFNKVKQCNWHLLSLPHTPTNSSSTKCVCVCARMAVRRRREGGATEAKWKKHILCLTFA